MSLPCLYPSDSPPGKSLFFASDLHAGAPSRAESAPRERQFVAWLETAAPEAAAFYLLGDLWDFWFEYRHSVPKGHVRLLGALAALTDAGIPVFFQPGNHDCWLTGYLTEEIGLRHLPDPFQAQWQGLRFFLSHGHRLGPLPHSDRLVYWIMENPLLGQLYRWIHPDIGLWLGRRLSGRSRTAHAPMDEIDLGPHEYFRQFVQSQLTTATAAHWYIFGHRHLALAETIGPAHVVVLGDWIQHFTYLQLAPTGWKLARFAAHSELPLAAGNWAVIRA